ncbi:putative uncharacterized protein [Firmicutes bacterium CAG:534]|nr:putative uncharacterized protein [Firmicutes bacterium CAG:534]
MILIEIKVPILDENYEFELDENLPVEEWKEDVFTLIERREGREFTERERLFLYDPAQLQVVDVNRNLRIQGIKQGSSLLLL